MTHEDLHNFRYSRNWSVTKLALFFRIPLQSVYDMEEGRVPIPEHLERHVLSGEPVPDPDEGKPRIPDPIIRKPKIRKPKAPKHRGMSGKELRYYRKALGLTLAQAAGKYADDKDEYKTPASWSNMESGKTIVPDRIEMFIKLEATDQGIPEYSQDAERLTPAHLRAFRRKYSLSQQAIALALNKSLSTWKRYETGKAEIPAKLRAALINLARDLNKGK